MAPCTNCNNTSPLTFSVQSFINSTCGSCGDSQCIPAKGVCYTGPDLPCSGIVTNDTLEDALTKLDEQLCSVIGDYSVYQMNCLPTWFGAPIENEGTFVDAITRYVCELTDNLEEFTGTEFTAFQTDVDQRLDAIEVPGFTCASAGITGVDSLNTIHTKFCTKFTAIDDALDMTDVNFAQCFTVTTPPATVKQGFELIIDQLCEVKGIAEGASGVTLPIFDNTGTCLVTPGATDTLEQTVIKIRTKLCELPSWDADNLTWGCVGAPVDNTDLEEGIGNILEAVNTLLPKQVAFGTGFTVNPTNVSEPCEGITVTLDGGVDRFVAATDTDVTPGTLEDKLEGVGIEINTVLNTNKITLVSDHKVLGALGDDSPNYLINKLNGSTAGGFTITPTYNAVTKKIDLILSVDPSAVCALVANCGGTIPCSGYTVTPSGTSTLSYTDCAGTVVNLTISGPVDICARINTVYAPNATIVNTGSCTPLAVADFSAINSSTNVIVSNITSSAVQFYTISAGAYNLEPSDIITGIGNTSGVVSVDVVSGTGIMTLYKNNIAQEAVEISGAGTYNFLSVVFGATDDLKIIFTDTPSSGDPGTFTLRNLTPDVTIDSVTPAFFLVNTGDFPCIPSEIIISDGVTSSSITLNVTYATGPTRYAALYKNGTLVEVITFTTTGAYSFAAEIFAGSDSMIIDVVDTNPEI